MISAASDEMLAMRGCGVFDDAFARADRSDSPAHAHRSRIAPCAGAAARICDEHRRPASWSAARPRRATITTKNGIQLSIAYLGLLQCFGLLPLIGFAARIHRRGTDSFCRAATCLPRSTRSSARSRSSRALRCAYSLPSSAFWTEIRASLRRTSARTESPPGLRFPAHKEVADFRSFVIAHL